MKHASTPVLKAVLTLTSAALPLAAQAINGLNLEGYGPVSTGLGGVSQAVDIGTAAMTQNPATLGLMRGLAQADVGLMVVGSRVTSSVPSGPSAESRDTGHAMPLLGYVRRSGSLLWGLGVYHQRGIGTQYGADTFLAAGSGGPVGAELSVGRVVLPLVWQPRSDLHIAASFDYVWSGLDLRIAMPVAGLGSIVTGGSGNLAAALPQAIAALPASAWSRVDFDDGKAYGGQAKGAGWATKLGLVWKPTEAWTLGGSWQSRTRLSDLKTGERGATLTLQGMSPIAGRITVVDDQWPEMLAVGAAWQATPAWMLAADVRHIGWKRVISTFRMRFESAETGSLAGSVEAALPQGWKDQTVVNLGVAHALNADVTLRAGLNLASSPVPAAMVNPLFTSTNTRHYTAGAGWKLGGNGELNASVTLAPEVTTTNASGIVIRNRQRNLQFMYTQRF